MDIISGLGAASQAIGIVKAIREVDKAMDAATLKVRINELLDALVDTKNALLDAKEAAAAKDAEIARLTAAFRDRATLVSGRDGYKYKANAAGGPDGYPACPHCDQVNGRIAFMVPDEYWQKGKCPACDKKFNPIYPYNSDGERSELAQRARDQAAYDAYDQRGPTGY